MVSNNLLGVENELVGGGNGLQVSGRGLRSLLPQSREVHPFQGRRLDTADVLSQQREVYKRKSFKLVV